MANSGGPNVSDKGRCFLARFCVIYPYGFRRNEGSDDVSDKDPVSLAIVYHIAPVVLD